MDLPWEVVVWVSRRSRGHCSSSRRDSGSSYATALLVHAFAVQSFLLLLLLLQLLELGFILLLVLVQLLLLQELLALQLLLSLQLLLLLQVYGAHAERAVSLFTFVLVLVALPIASSFFHLCVVAIACRVHLATILCREWRQVRVQRWWRSRRHLLFIVHGHIGIPNRSSIAPHCCHSHTHTE